jgi:iron(II)-dependent oxidoreductase
MALRFARNPKSRSEKSEMTDPLILGQLSGLHEMIRELVRRAPPEQVNAPLDPELGCLAWYLGHSVFREIYWLREVIAQDADLTGRVRHLFGPAAKVRQIQCAQLPPPEHLLRWAQEIQDEHLRRLATPGALPAHPLLAENRLQWLLLQEAARDYERMLMVLHLRRLQGDARYRVVSPLTAHTPAAASREVVQGHYRIGARGEPFAYDNELPPQAVELASFRIALRPVSNAEYLAFMEAGGYRERAFWSEAGRQWLAVSGVSAPLHWRRDAAGHWYGIGLNGPSDLPAADPVSGVSQHEAAAYAAWTARLGGDLRGAVLQHEYQWEVAARSGVIENAGQVWEWCANTFHPYPEFTPYPDASVSQEPFGHGYVSLRGASLHTQRCLRRASFRNWAAARSRHAFAGIRLIFPPS